MTGNDREAQDPGPVSVEHGRRASNLRRSSLNTNPPNTDNAGMHRTALACTRARIG